MTKDIFESDYFSKHRSTSGWDDKEKGRIHKYLNLKNKPRFDEPINVPEDSDDDVFDSEPNSAPESAYQTEFMRLVFAGFAGGLIVLIYALINFIGVAMFSWLFWKSLLVVILTGAIVFLLLGLVLKIFTRR